MVIILILERRNYLIHFRLSDHTGWGSGAVIKKMKGEPLQSSVALIVSDLQKYGYAVVENLYEDLCVEKLGYEVKDVVRNGIANNSMCSN